MNFRLWARFAAAYFRRNKDDDAMKDAIYGNTEARRGGFVAKVTPAYGERQIVSR